MKPFSITKQARLSRSLRVYQTSTDNDYFYNHTNTVMLGFFVAVAAILFFLMLTVWTCYKIF